MKSACLWHKTLNFPPQKTNFITTTIHKIGSYTTKGAHLCKTHTPKTPIFLKPLLYKTPSSDLSTFFSWAHSLIPCSALGDDPLDPTLLKRELRWFLDDVVEDPRNLISSDPSLVLQTRQSLDDMYRLWRERVEERRPFQYIVGCEHWRDLVISVEEGVLIPRPETAEVVDIVGEGVREFDGLREGVWADLGTGSGALAIGIAKVLGGRCKVVATDISDFAVSVARYNVERYMLQDIIEVRQGSWFDPLTEFEGKLAGFVSNPPYIPSEDISGLQAEVGKHEPKVALDGGVEGLDYLNYICQKASTMLKPGGFFALETNGKKQCEILADRLENGTGSSIVNVNIVSDFAGIPRFVTGYRK